MTSSDYPAALRAAAKDVKGILFDKDGTLFDYHASWAPVNAGAALEAARGDPVLADTLLRAGGLDPVTGRYASGSLLAAAHTGEIAEEWARIMNLPAGDLPDLIDRLDRRFQELGAIHAAPVGDLPALMAGFRARGLTLGVATSDSEHGARRMLADVDCGPDLIGFVAGYDSGHGGKPTPGMVHGFCAATGLESRSVLVVGDNLHDIRMARAAGCRMAIGVLTGTSLLADLESEADAVLDSILDLESLLNG